MFLALNPLGLARYDNVDWPKMGGGNSAASVADILTGGQEMQTRGVPNNDPPIFIGKWTVQILFSLNERPYRHGQLQRALGGISQRMLTRTLRNLESTGLIARGAAGSDARAVSYSLTQLGKTFIAPLSSMCEWAKQNRKDISAEVRLLETSRGTSEE